LKLDGVFIEIGAIPVTTIIKKLGIQTDESSYIHVNENMETNVSGIFAGGDVVKSKLKQIITAANQGAIAAKSSYNFIKNL